MQGKEEREGNRIRGQYAYSNALLNSRIRVNQTSNAQNSTPPGETTPGRWNNMSNLNPPRVGRIATGATTGQRTWEKNRQTTTSIPVEATHVQFLNQSSRLHIGGTTARTGQYDWDERTECATITRTTRPTGPPQQYSQHQQDDAMRDQRRAARWRLQTERVRGNKRSFQAGARKFQAELVPTHSQIMEELNRERWSGDTAAGEFNNAQAQAQERHDGHTNEDATVRELLAQWEGGAHGYVPEAKEDNIIRIACENTNGIGLFHKDNLKVRKLLNLNSRHQTDGMCIVEHGINFGHREAKGDKQPAGIFASFKGSRSSAGYNKHENHSQYMAGGTMVATFSRLSSFVINQGVDRTGLGRWSWILVGSGSHRTIMVSAYQPQKSSNKRQLVTAEGRMIQAGTVAAQHRRHFVSKGNFNNPRDIFSAQLVTQLKEWRSKGYEIILFADLNENIYTGPLSQQLQQPGLLMEEQTLKSTDQKAPHSHQSGKTPIVGTFATPGILCTNSYLSPHGTGVGDHRFQLHDFDASSVLGTEYPKTVRPTGRKLRSDVPKCRKKYTKRLKKDLSKHRVFEKLEFLHLNKATLPRDKFQQIFNS